MELDSSEDTNSAPEEEDGGDEFDDGNEYDFEKPLVCIQPADIQTMQWWPHW